MYRADPISVAANRARIFIGDRAEIWS
jgi:hypothetical protein